MKTKIQILTASGLLITAAILVHFRVSTAENDEDYSPATGASGVTEDHGRGNDTDSRFSYRRVQRPETERHLRQELLRILLSDDPSGKVAAARDLAAYNDEDAFKAIAECVARTEVTGDFLDADIVEELVQILGTMRGEGLIQIATEFAYGPSRAVSEAGTNVAVASNGAQTYGAFETEASGSEQVELTEFVGELLQADQ